MQEDGRRVRREVNRGAVIDALGALFAEGIYQPSAAQIAERAGLSPRSLFRYFEDIDDLNRAAIEHQLAAARPLLELGVGPAAPTGVKIRCVVEGRGRLFAAIEPAARAARISAHRRHVLAAQLRESRSYLRHQLERLFAPELKGERSALLPAVDALCSFETYELLRVDQRLSGAETATAMTAALTALLDSDAGER